MERLQLREFIQEQPTKRALRLKILIVLLMEVRFMLDIADFFMEIDLML